MKALLCPLLQSALLHRLTESRSVPSSFVRPFFVRSKKSCSFIGYEPKVLSALGSVASCLARVHGFGIASATEQSGFRGPSG